MSKIEYYIPRINGWIQLNFEEYLSLLFDQEDQKYNRLKSIKGLPIHLLTENDKTSSKNNRSIENSTIVSGNFIEVLLSQNHNIEAENLKGVISLLSSSEGVQKSYNIWVQAKIVSADIKNKLILLEYNDQIIVVDDLEKIRTLNEVKLNREDITVVYVKKVTNSEYETFKAQYDKISPENNKFLFHKYDVIKSSFFLVCNKSYLKNLPFLKELEVHYGLHEDSNNNSEANGSSNIDSGKNIIGIGGGNGMTSRSGRSESSQRSEKSKKSNITHEEEDILNDISNFKYKETFVYKSLFKKELEKILGEIFKKIKYYVTKLSDEEFKVIVYSNEENEFIEEKSFFEKNYKALEIKNETIASKNDVQSLATKTKIKYAYIEKKNIYLVGEEKNIINFKTVWSMNLKYDKEIQKNYKEKENYQRELTEFRKKHKIFK